MIRKETGKDYKLTEAAVEKAFQNEEHSDHREQFLVARLRKSDVFVPELSLVAERNKAIVGHLMLTKLLIKNDGQNYEALALAPVSVLPELIGTVISGFLRFRVKIRFFPRTTTVFAPRTTNPIRIFRQRRLQEV